MILVKAGHKIPVDGKVAGGNASVNESPITVESVPKEKTQESEVYAGTILENGALSIRILSPTRR